MFKHKPGVEGVVGYDAIRATPDKARLGFQDHYTWVWPTQGTQYGARVTNCWYGNQLPNWNNTIPGVPAYLWRTNRSPQISHNVQYTTGAGGRTIVGNSASASLMSNAQQAWANYGG